MAKSLNFARVIKLRKELSLRNYLALVRLQTIDISIHRHNFSSDANENSKTDRNKLITLVRVNY